MNLELSKKKVILAVTGASGSVYAKKLIESLQNLDEQIEEKVLIFSESGKSVWKYELEDDFSDFRGFTIFGNENLFASCASGSAQFDTMIVCPCSVGTLGKISSGIANNLICRSADVILKERKKLILVVREMPFNLIHLRNMSLITKAGGIICPASPNFYSKPGNLDEVIQTVVNKVLQLSGFQIDSFRW